MARATLRRMDRGRLRAWFVLLFLACAIPSVVLVEQAYSRLKWETFHQYRGQAEELAGRIDARLARMIAAEQARSFDDYGFLTVTGDPSARFVQRSPLSAWPVRSELPGVLGYFQVDADGSFSTPLVPRDGVNAQAYGVAPKELAERITLAARLRDILGSNRLVQVHPGLQKKIGVASTAAAPARAAPEPEIAQPGAGESPQAAFDLLNAPATVAAQRKSAVPGALGKVEELKLKERYAAKPAPQELREQADRLAERDRTDTAAESGPRAPASVAAAPPGGGRARPARVSTFEGEIDPFELSLLDSGHFVLYRKVWRDGGRYVQGMLLDREALLAGVVASGFEGTGLARMSDLAVAWRGDVLLALTGGKTRGYAKSAGSLEGSLLYRGRLSAPFSDLELIFGIRQLPPGPGATVLAWTVAVLILALCGGFFLLYRLAAGQLDLARQQQDFVSAVSHELKTPLTSIRMYGEILREGWADEDKRREYYEYIHDEAERLSRLIANVLQLARMSRQGIALEPRDVAVSELVDGLRSKIAGQVQRAGFALEVACEDTAADTVVRVDADAFTQILINLVDNALKFSARSDRKQIDVACRRERDGTVAISVRDYGPGIARDQMRKIFRLFYRAESELTRETVGTGIGLALVEQLARAMGARVDVVNAQPGAQFRLLLPTKG